MIKHLLILVLIFPLFLFIVPSKLFAVWRIDYQGRIILLEKKNQVLGAKDDNSEDKDKDKEKEKKDKNDDDDKKSPTSTNIPIPSPTNVPTATETPTSIPANTPTSIPIPTNTPTPTKTPTSTNTPTPTDEPTPTNVPVVIAAIESQAVVTATPTPTNSPINTPTPTTTPVQTSIPTPTPTQTPITVQQFTNVVRPLTKNVVPTPPITEQQEIQGNFEVKQVLDNFLNVKIEPTATGFTVLAQAADGTMVQLGDQKVFEIEDRSDKSIIRLYLEEKGTMVITKGSYGAFTKLPIRVNLDTNSIHVATQNGIQKINNLPDLVVKTLVAGNVLDAIARSTGVSTNIGREMTQTSTLFELGNVDGKPTYEVPGVSYEKLFGVMPIEIHKSAFVSAVEKNLVKVNTPLVSRILEGFVYRR